MRGAVCVVVAAGHRLGPWAGPWMTPSVSTSPRPQSGATGWREHHSQPEGVWLVQYKPRTGKPAIPYEEAICEALCFGWVDSTYRRLDEERGTLWWSPRRKGSLWASSNKARVERLEAEGRMTEAGRVAIEAAKADGSWTILEPVEALDRAPTTSRPRWRSDRVPPSTGGPSHPRSSAPTCSGSPPPSGPRPVGAESSSRPTSSPRAGVSTSADPGPCRARHRSTPPPAATSTGGHRWGRRPLGRRSHARPARGKDAGSDW